MEIENPELLVEAIEAIQQRPHGWDQSIWGKASDDVMPLLEEAHIPNRDFLILPEGVSCGTSMCLAGQVVSLAGFPLLWWPGDPHADLCWDDEKGEVLEVMAKARELLGINQHLASAMFSADAAKATHEELDAIERDDDYLDTTERKDDIDRFKRNLTHWTGVQFPDKEDTDGTVAA